MQSQKKNNLTTNITNSKTKKLINFIQNKQFCPLKNYKQK